MRLQKFLARSGVASRRGSEALVAAGRVRVNGATVTEMGTKVDPAHDVVEVDGAPVRLLEEDVVLMLHKPLGYVTTMKDDHAHRIVADLVPLDRYPSLFPLGRLDRDTTGLLLFSTDGELGHALLRPRGHVVKRYLALVEGTLTQGQLAALRDGVMLDDGPTLPAEVRVLQGPEKQRALEMLEMPPLHAKKVSREYARALSRRAADRAVVQVGIHEGRNRQVRRMLGAVGHPVVALHRQSFGPLDLGDLPRGEWRLLAAEEAAALGEAVAKD